MANLIVGGIVGSVVEKLLTKVLKATALALHHNTYCKELHTLLTRLQPLVSEVCAKAADGASAGSIAAHNWLESLHRELTEADEILQESSSINSVNVIERISSSKKIVSVMQRINGLVQEVGLLGLSSSQDVKKAVETLGEEGREYFEVLSAQLTSLQQQLNCLEVSMTTRNAFLTPVCNYGHGVGIITADRALSEIKGSAESALSHAHIDPLISSLGALRCYQV